MSYTQICGHVTIRFPMPFFAIKLALFLHLYDLFPVRSVLFIVDTTCFVRLISSLFTPPSELELNFTLQQSLGSLGFVHDHIWQGQSVCPVLRNLCR